MKWTLVQWFLLVHDPFYLYGNGKFEDRYPDWEMERWLGLLAPKMARVPSRALRALHKGK